jgi:hypothetical protein
MISSMHRCQAACAGFKRRGMATAQSAPPSTRHNQHVLIRHGTAPLYRRVCIPLAAITDTFLASTNPFPFACSFLIRLKILHPGQPAATTLLDFMQAKDCFVKKRKADAIHSAEDVTALCNFMQEMGIDVGSAQLHKTVLGPHEI